jgi:molybdate transport system substrate-binding protein|nr:substrate-binding domain-containing protein [uncultured Halomonas sp.]
MLVNLPAISALASDSVHVAAATSLTDALNDAITVYEEYNDDDVTAIHTSSSTLARQIVNGSPHSYFFRQM